MGDEIGGHHVSGHVHTTAKVQKIEVTENNKRITFQVCSASACLHCTSLPAYQSICRWHSTNAEGKSRGFVHTKHCLLLFASIAICGGCVLQVPKQWMKYILAKGFIAVDGCSLTVSNQAVLPDTYVASCQSRSTDVLLFECLQVGEVGEDWFTIYLIPETLRVTVLGNKQEGDTVNLEIEAQTQVTYFYLCQSTTRSVQACGKQYHHDTAGLGKSSCLILRR